MDSLEAILKKFSRNSPRFVGVPRVFKSVSLRNSFECNCLKLLVSKYNEHYAYLSCYAIEWNNGPATLLYGFRAKISWYELSNSVLVS